jgi:hypothetical protein
MCEALVGNPPFGLIRPALVALSAGKVSFVADEFGAFLTL